MYLSQSERQRADGSTVSYLQLGENVWVPERQRSETRVVYNRGRADDAAVVERLRKLAASILRRCSPEELVGGAGPDVRFVCAWPYGELDVLQAFFWSGQHASPREQLHQPGDRGLQQPMHLVAGGRTALLFSTRARVLAATPSAADSLEYLSGDAAAQVRVQAQAFVRGWRAACGAGAG